MRQVLDIVRAKLTVELTNRCNLRCRMCPTLELRRPTADLEWGLVEKLSAELAALGKRVDWLHELGEPLLYPRLVEAIEAFPGAAVSTNAAALDQVTARRLLATSLPRIRLCIDTVDPETYPLIRRGGNFERVVANIRRFLELAQGSDLAIEIQKLITLASAHETVADFEAFFDLGRFPNARVVEKTCEGLDTADATDLHQRFYGCFQGHPLRYLVVLADGSVTHCCYDANGEQLIGDLTHQTLAEIAASERVAEVARAFRARDWEALPRCGECHRNPSGAAILREGLLRAGHRLERVVPLKSVARKIINR